MQITNLKNEKGHAKYSMREQAEKYIAARANRGLSKSTGAILRSDRTVTRCQGDLGRAAEYIQVQFDVKKLKDITSEQAQTFISKLLKDGIRVRTVQGYAKALELLPCVQKLDVPSRADDPFDKPKDTRAYTLNQITEIQLHLKTPQAKLAKQIILESSCRAKDLASLCLAEERPLVRARIDQLHADRFTAREDWIKVSFIGKGGHHYISTISPQTAQALSQYRLTTPRDFRERNQENIVTKQYYDLPAGLKLSKQWCETAFWALGLKRGLHGLRHTFAQQRVRDLQNADMTCQKALECVSQQMGHYRASEVMTYLR